MKRTALKRKAPLGRGQGLRQGKGFAASPAQRLKVRDASCAVCGRDGFEATLDPAHLVSRAVGGCGEPLCVVPLCRVHHQLFDGGGMDLLPHLVKRWVPELQHALEHLEGDLVGLLERLTNERWATVERAVG